MPAEYKCTQDISLFLQVCKALTPAFIATVHAIWSTFALVAVPGLPSKPLQVPASAEQQQMAFEPLSDAANSHARS